MALALLFKTFNLDQISLSAVSEDSFFPSSAWKRLSYQGTDGAKPLCLSLVPREREKRAMKEEEGDSLFLCWILMLHVWIYGNLLAIQHGTTTGSHLCSWSSTCSREMSEPESPAQPTVSGKSLETMPYSSQTHLHHLAAVSKFCGWREGRSLGRISQSKWN